MWFRRQSGSKPGERSWKLVAPHWYSVDVHDQPSVVLSQLAALRPPSKNLLAAYWLFSEVENGAFPQFFWNSTGVLAPEALAAFRELGLAEAAVAIEKAMHLFGDPYPRDDAARQEILGPIWNPRAHYDEELLESLLDLTEQFYDALGKKLRLFYEAADAYAERASSDG
jgi:hypothetical protein